MARRVDVSTISSKEQDFIRKHLILTPKKLTRNPNIPDPRPFNCWTVSDGYVHLPYAFAGVFEKHMDMPLHKEPASERDYRYSFTKGLRDYQEPLMETALSQLESLHSTRLWTHPGSGKTAMSMYLASKVSGTKPTLIILPAKIALIKSWEGTVSNFTDARQYTVGTKVDSNELYNAQVVICLDSRLDKLPDGYITSVGTLIVDECHTFAKTQGRIDSLLSVVCDYVILATATFTIENGMDRFLVFVAGHHHVRREYQEPIRMVKVNTHVNPKMEEPDIGVLRYKLIRDDRYTEWIVRAVKKYMPTENILILTWLTEQIDLLMPALEAAGIQATSYYGSQKQYIENQVCVGTLGKVGFGFDEAYAAVDFSGIPFSCIVLPLTVKDSAFYEQIIGRGMRSKNPLFVTFIDSHFITRAHWKKNAQWVETHNVELSEIEADDL